MIDSNLVEAVCEQLHSWAWGSRKLPGYELGFGKPHLYWLLTGKVPSKDAFEWIDDLYEIMTEDCARGLLSQHGWCIYQVLLARRGVKEETS